MDCDGCIIYSVELKRHARLLDAITTSRHTHTHTHTHTHLQRWRFSSNVVWTEKGTKMSTHPLHTTLGSLFFFFFKCLYVCPVVHPTQISSSSPPHFSYHCYPSFFQPLSTSPVCIRPSTQPFFLATFLHFLSMVIVSTFTVFLSFLLFFFALLFRPCFTPLYPFLFYPFSPSSHPSFLKNIELVCPSHILLSLCLSSLLPSPLYPSTFISSQWFWSKRLLFSCFPVSPFTSLSCFCFLHSFETYPTHSPISFCQSFPVFPLLITGFPLILR